MIRTRQTLGRDTNCAFRLYLIRLLLVAVGLRSGELTSYNYHKQVTSGRKNTDYLPKI